MQIQISDTNHNVNDLPKTTFKEWFKCRISSSFQKRHLEQQAQCFINALTSQNVTSPRQALKNPTIRAARKFIKNVPKKYQQTEIFQIFHQALIASRLALPLECLEKNPDFAQFSRKYCLYNLLSTYDDRLDYQENTNTLLIKCKEFKEPISWKEVPKEYLEPLPENGRKRVEWKYGPQGLQNEDLCEPIPRPFMITDPSKWSNHYLVEICASCIHKPRIRGDHVWMRLYSKDGSIYSRGKMGKEGIMQNFQFPLRLKQGWLEWPDISDLWGLIDESQADENFPSEVQTIYFKVDQETFEKMYEKFWNERCSFHLLSNNCYHDSRNIFEKICHVFFPTRMHVVWLFVPKPLKNLITKIYEHTPHIIRQICKVVFFPLKCISALFLNLILLMMGASKVHKKVKQVDFEVEAHINTKNWWKIFTHDLLYLNPPFAIAEISREIKAWREKKLQHLENRRGLMSDEEYEQKKDDILYGIPKKYKVNTH